MSAIVAYWLRARLRRPGALVLLALLVAVGVGGAGAAGAGARRTASAEERLNAISSPPDLFASASDLETLEAALDRPDVAAWSGLQQAAVQPATAPCSDDSDAYFPFFASVGGTPFGVATPRVVAGRLPDPSRIDEVAIPEQHAARLGLGVGDELALLPITIDEESGASGCGAEPVVTVRVVGVLRELLEIGAADEPTLAWTYITPALLAAHPELSMTSLYGHHSLVDLREGADLSSFLEDLRATPLPDDGFVDGFGLAGPSPIAPAMDALATGLWGLAGALALTALGLIAAGIARQLAGAVEELRALGELGVGRRTLTIVGAVPIAGAVLAGLLLAPLVTAGLSPLHPVGLARRVEPDPGLDVDLTVIGLAALAGLVVCGILIALLGWRAATRATAPQSAGSGEQGALGAGGAIRRLPLPAAIGVSLAFERARARASLPGRTAVVGVLAGTAGVVGVLVFGLGVRHANDDPVVYGWGSWDAQLAHPDDSDQADADMARELADDTNLAAVSQLTARFQLELDGEQVAGTAIEHLRGRAGPTVVRGRLPEGVSELALGRATADDLGLAIGDDVRAGGPHGERALRVVGIVATPGFDSDPINAGWTAERAALDVLGYEPGCNNSDCFQPVLVEVSPGLDASKVLAAYGDEGLDVQEPTPTGAVLLLSEADQLPSVTAAGIALLAAVGLAHATTVTVSRRRRELAMLKALGLERRRTSLVLVAEGLAIAVVGGALGALLGLAGGRLAWQAAARAIGIGPSLPTVWSTPVAVLVAVLALAVVLSVWPARAAARLQPAVALRSER